MSKKGVEGKVIEFIGELRKAGVNVTVSETIDAVRACVHLSDFDLSVFKFALRSVLIKNESELPIFDSVFNSFFIGLPLLPVDSEGSGEIHALSPNEFASEIKQIIRRALLDGDSELLSSAAETLAMYASNGAFTAQGESGAISLSRGPGYYVFRALDLINFREMVSSLRAELAEGKRGGVMPLQMRLDELESGAEIFERELVLEVRKRVAPRSKRDDNRVDTIEKQPLRIDEIEFTSARTDQIEEMRRLLAGISRMLAAKIARKYAKGTGGKIDFRNTLRHSVSYGGAPFDLKFKKRKRSKPDLYVLCDISGSVRNFSSFTLQLVFSLQAQFRSVRSFVFIDRIDEVTETFRLCDASEAIERAYRESRVVDGDGHSDVGRALEQFVEGFSDEISPRSTVLILSDARNNSKDPRLDAMERLKERTARIYWLNPEPQSRWDTGDSLMSEYAPYCKSVRECRNLKQLAEFVSKL